MRYRQSHGARLRAVLLASSAVIAAPALAQDATWNGAGMQWTNAANWLPAFVPAGVATFDGSGSTDVRISSAAAVTQIDFTSATLYSLRITAGTLFQVTGPGITGAGIAPDVTNLGGFQFANAATAGGAIIVNNGGVTHFLNQTTAANADITNRNDGMTVFGTIGGTDTATAGNATITNRPTGGETIFLALTTAGAATIVNNGGTTSFFENSNAGTANITNKNGGGTLFTDRATAAGAIIENLGGCGCTPSSTTFAGMSDAGTATITNKDFGILLFRDNAAAADATIVNNNFGETDFLDQSTAGNADITNRNGGVTIFGTAGGTDTATAGNATITNRVTGGETIFQALTTAGTATIINNGGTTSFFEKSNADAANVTNRNGGLTVFADEASAANATIVNRDGFFFFPSQTVFSGMSTAANANITNQSFGATLFVDGATAGNATIVNNADGITLFGTPFFTDTPTAGNATITNNAGGMTQFGAFSTAGSATIISNNGGAVGFFDNATGGNAQFITDAGGIVDFSQTLGPAGNSRITAGSIAGAGDYYLGGIELTVGGNNLSTEVSGTINDGVSPLFCGCAPPSMGASLVKVGTGTLILSGVNTYTGPTTVNDGMLAIAPAGSITSEVTNNAFFLNAGMVTGNLFNTGTTANTGVIVGAATIDGGFVGNDGTITGLVTVNAGGTLGGNGHVGGAIVNGGGNLSPGNSIGTIQINGNLSFVGPGNYLVEVSPTAADRVDVTGVAALGGTLHAFATGTGYKIGTTYTVINATGGVTGTFGNLDIVGHFGATKPHIEYDGTNVFLVLGANAISPSLVGGTPNQKAVAGAVDAALLAGNQLAPFDALFNIATGLPGALDQLSGEVHASTLGVLVDESLYVRSAVLGRLRQASYGGDPEMAALSAGGPQLALMDDALTTLLAYGGKSLPVKAPLTAPAPSRDVAFWTQGFGAWGKFGGDGNAAGVRRDLAGFFTGVDARFGNGRGGIAAGYTASRNNLDGRGSANVESGHLAAYGGWSFGALRLRGGGAYAWHTIDTDRTIALPGFFDRANGHYNGGTGQIFGEAGYGFAFGRVAVEPFAGAAWVHLSADAFNERGGAAALRVAANSFEVGYSTLGIRAASMIPLWSDMILVPRVSAAWQHAFSNVTPAAALAFQGAGAPFVIAGVPIARDSLLGEAGLDLAIGRHATLGVSYTGQLARNVHDHAAKGKFSWRF